jgi:hypothetical protein
MDLNTEMAPIFEQVVAMRDRYGLHAYLTALENAGLQSKMQAEIKALRPASKQDKAVLLEVLRTGTVPPERHAPQEKASTAAASCS